MDLFWACRDSGKVAYLLMKKNVSTTQSMVDRLETVESIYKNRERCQVRQSRMSDLQRHLLS